jgi:hypothetical protein
MPPNGFGKNNRVNEKSPFRPVKVSLSQCTQMNVGLLADNVGYHNEE